jgi:two-component system chemotaxis response regulator CheY
MDQSLSGTARLRPLSILFAEDNEAMGPLLKHTLEIEGHSVDWARDGSQALEKFSSAPDHYDMVITDHNMPRLNGLELVGALRGAGYLGMILVQSSSLTTVLSRAYSVLGVNAFLTKPFLMEDILAILQRLFGA